MSTEQVLREYPWLNKKLEEFKGLVPFLGRCQVTIKEVRVSRISLELFLRRDKEKRDEHGRTEGAIYYDLFDKNGDPVGEGPSLFDRMTLFNRFLTCCSDEDREKLTYIVRCKFLRGDRWQWVMFVTFFKPPRGYTSVQHFVKKFHRRLRKMHGSS